MNTKVLLPVLVRSLSLLAGIAPLAAQPANDNCDAALVIADVTNWCSDPAAFTNAGATAGPFGQPSCFPDLAHDVWFAFVAEATTVQVTVIGNTAGNTTPGGTLENPQFAVYSGTCGGTLTEIACASDGFGTNIVESFAGPLTVGQTYYIRVDARFDQTGTFQLCINNFNAVPDPSSDCPTGVILCDKSPFTVESLVGTGNLNDEIGPGVCVQIEFASAWYRWTCQDPGTLSFTITPTNPSDDIDFAVFELPGGIDDCSGKVKLRCMAAGENVGQPFPNWAVCTGPTGLSEDETDLDEFPGCAPGQNNFVAALDMEAGKSYALIINNFSNTGSGFQLTFGGTGTFQGPQVDFTAAPSPVCTGDAVTFTDASAAVEGISEWNWNFGVGAMPATATGPGPHDVSYPSAGPRSVVLTVTSESGCAVTDIRQVEVLPAPAVDLTTLADYCGPDTLTGAVFLAPAGTASVPYSYDWENDGFFVPDSTRVGLAAGNYSVTVRSADGCLETIGFTVEEGLALAAGVDPAQSPTCHGGSDGSISITIDIANEPVLFDFGNGYQPSNTLSGIPAGSYAVQVVDAAGCAGDFVIEVVDFPPLAVAVQSVNISCFGDLDGMVTALPEGGAGGYVYQWAHGPTTGGLSGLAAGTYAVTVTDANGCTAAAGAVVAEPAPLFLTFTTEDVLCHGEATGVIRLTAQGGTPPYQYSADGNDFQPDPVLTGLAAGTYDVAVLDASGCEADQPALIQEPAPFVVEAGPDQSLDLGYQVELQGLVLPPFSAVDLGWSPDDALSCNSCLDPVASPVSTTTYFLTAVDANGCVSEDSVVVTVLLKRPVYIPNAFTPNADGLNDFFTVYAGPAARIVRSLKVFSRWGSLVYEGYDLPLNQDNSGWDGLFRGQVLDPGVFAYVAEVEFIDGVVVLHEGDVMILR